MIYLDWAATACPDMEILNKAHETAAGAFGNPSSHHAPGREAKKLIDWSRSVWADALRCSADQIYFTSGGTESNNLVMQHLFLKKKYPSILVSGIEHASVYETAVRFRNAGGELSIARADTAGHVSAEIVRGLLTPYTAFAAVMAVNNETGAVSALDEIIQVIRDYEKSLGKPIHIHVDAVQAFGKVPFAVDRFAVDSASFSAHKIGGPRGAGVLFLRRPQQVISAGGEQESGIRPGTENVYAVYGAGLAAEKAVQQFDKYHAHVSRLMNILISECRKIPEITLFRPYAADGFSPYILNLYIPPVPGEVIVRVCNDHSIALGTGSACSSSSAGKRKRIRTNMGIPDHLSDSAIRVSIGHSTTEEEIGVFLKVLQNDIIPLARMIS